MITHRCHNCQWWDDQHPTVKLIPLEFGKERVGFCRKHKPGSLRKGDHFYGVQPVTDANEFCGEFRLD
jgi:hypothetical protein